MFSFDVSFYIAINVPPDQRKQHILWVKYRRVNSIELGQANFKIVYVRRLIETSFAQLSPQTFAIYFDE